MKESEPSSLSESRFWREQLSHPGFSGMRVPSWLSWALQAYAGFIGPRPVRRRLDPSGPPRWPNWSWRPQPPLWELLLGGVTSQAACERAAQQPDADERGASVRRSPLIWVFGDTGGGAIQ